MEFFPLQLELLTQQAMRAGFTGGLVVDYPNSTKAKKYKFIYVCTLVCYRILSS